MRHELRLSCLPRARVHYCCGVSSLSRQAERFVGPGRRLLGTWHLLRTGPDGKPAWLLSVSCIPQDSDALGPPEPGQTGQKEVPGNP